MAPQVPLAPEGRAHLAAQPMSGPVRSRPGGAGRFGRQGIATTSSGAGIGRRRRVFTQRCGCWTNACRAGYFPGQGQRSASGSRHQADRGSCDSCIASAAVVRAILTAIAGWLATTACARLWTLALKARCASFSPPGCWAVVGRRFPRPRNGKHSSCTVPGCAMILLARTTLSAMRMNPSLEPSKTASSWRAIPSPFSRA